ncbi:MAG: ATP-binding cassette domain-containing protein [Clostridiales bacterium]|nr:ATP-binding cassette domain-containing protein [Clostridiales bacterium]
MRIEIKDLHKSFDGGADVLTGISLYDDIKALAVIGSSGCGKSTLLRIIGGLIPATSGSVLLDGEPAADNERYRRNIGFVFQQGGLFSHLSAEDNIVLPLVKAHGFSAVEAGKRARGLLSRFGLENEAGKMPLQLSGGQKQRISIARAVAPKPKLLLLDEPTSALDPEYTTDVLSMVKELGEEGLSFIIATHEMGFALHACGKVAFLDQGKIAEYGESKDVFGSPGTEKLGVFLSKLLEWKV